MTDQELHRQEWISERAAIFEFSAGYPRDAAEMMAELAWDARSTAQERAGGAQ